MAELSNYLENALINAVLRNTTYTSVATVYAALYTSDPTDADSGTEVSTGAYARQAVTFGAPSNGSTSNTGAVSFTASGASWGSITHVGLRDALTTGNLLWHSPLDTARTINDGDTLQFAIGAIVATLA